jgi:hypothetical protein
MAQKSCSVLRVAKYHRQHQGNALIVGGEVRTGNIGGNVELRGMGGRLQIGDVGGNAEFKSTGGDITAGQFVAPSRPYR